MNKLVGITLGAVAVYSIVRLLKVQNIGDQTSNTMVNPGVHAVNLDGLSFFTKVAINSPSKDMVIITKTVVSVKVKRNYCAKPMLKTRKLLKCSVLLKSIPQRYKWVLTFNLSLPLRDHAVLPL